MSMEASEKRESPADAQHARIGDMGASSLSRQAVAVFDQACQPASDPRHGPTWYVTRRPS